MGVGQQGQHNSVVRIFLASSAELKEHRREFELFIGRQNKLDLWKQRGIRFEVELWEDFVDALSATRLQDEYNKAIAGCDLFVLLFRTKVGKYTAEEFEKAFGQFKATGRPLVYTYFHNSSAMLGGIDRADMQSLWAFQDKLKELQHFQTVYDHDEGLCLSFSQQLLKLDGDGRLLPHDQPHGGGSHAPAISPARQRELAYLDHLIHQHLAHHQQRYVPIAGEETTEQRLERVLADVVMPSDFIVEAFGLAPDEAHGQRRAPTPYPDVLQAYRALPQRGSVRRLAVLGEPGAGKTFSLGRIAHEKACEARDDPKRPVPLLAALGLWTDADEPLDAFIARRCAPLERADVARLLGEGRLMLLLDAVNEVPPGQRPGKLAQIKALAQDDRLAALLMSCRERDFQADGQVGFDILRLLPLRPLQVSDFLRQTLALVHGQDEGERRAEAKFWQIAGGDELRSAWQAWHSAGASFELFWTADDIPRENPNVYSKTSGSQDEAWRQARTNPRSLLKLASNPFLLTVMMQLPTIPANRAQLIDGFIGVLYKRELQASTRRGDGHTVPAQEDWRSVLVQVAEALQRVDGDVSDDGARTALARADWPVRLDDAMLAFCIDTSVLQRVDDDLRFTHQLLQEALAADVLLQAAATQARPASDFWPADRWWQCSGWEVVAEITAEALAGDRAAQVRLITWLARHHPGLALDIWRHVDAPALPAALLTDTKAQWLPRLTDTQAEPAPEARAAIGRWLGALDLDDRPGTGLGPDGLPDIDWLPIDDDSPWHYQDEPRPPLPPYAIARYAVTHRQWQAFVDDGGYADDRWWQGLDERPEPTQAQWGEPTAPRERVGWFEAVVFCRWLTARLGNVQVVTLPSEQQWERAARGTDGRTYPWGDEWSSDLANAVSRVAQTTLVGLYPEGQAPCGALDMAGNVWEWCLNEYDEPANTAVAGPARRVVRGGSWNGTAGGCRAAFRNNQPTCAATAQITPAGTGRSRYSDGHEARSHSRDPRRPRAARADGAGAGPGRDAGFVRRHRRARAGASAPAAGRVHRAWACVG